jgi:hypothetical protein
MANEGFKGTRIQIDTLTIGAGPTGVPVLKVGVQFASEEGDIHAVASHNFLLDSETSTDGIAPAVAELIRLVTKLVEAKHFIRPNDTESPVLQGIAESLRGKPSLPDEPGTQG